MIYLDSAATTLQKPPAVVRAASYAMNHLASPGRGGHWPAMQAAETVFACRQEAAELFHADDPEQVVLTCNATHALNLAIKSLVRPGDTVLISSYEHNAVTRPLYALGANIRVAAGPLFHPAAMLDAFEAKLTPEIQCVVCTHVSNVFGYILPIQEIAALCRSCGVPLIVDASQSAGCLPVHLKELGAAFIAMPGHKGLYGPQGTGLLLCNRETVPLLEGGTGSRSADQAMPDFLPDRLEAGTHNVPGAAGLLAGLRFVKAKGLDHILEGERALTIQAARGLSSLPGVTVYAAKNPVCQAGVLSFSLDGMDCEVAGEALGEREIAVRAGLHCAPLAHKAAGTFETGTIRASFSAFNHSAEVGRLVWEVTRLAGRR